MAKKELFVEASILKRMGAFLIDLLIIELVVGYPFQRLIANYSPKNLFDLIALSENSAIIKIGAVISLLSLVYFFLFEKRLGQTPGKMVFNLYVVGTEDRVNAWQYLARSMYFIPVMPFSALWVIDPIYILFDKKRRRISEVLSKTQTIEKVNRWK